MKILHLTTGLQKASGVTTFVEGASAALNEIGVLSCASTNLRDLDVVKPDVVHLHGLWTPFYHHAANWAKNAGVPIVWSTHGMLAPWSLRHKWWKKIPAWLLYQWRDLKSAAMFHATVEAEAQWIRNLGFKQPIVVAPLGTTLPQTDAEFGKTTSSSTRGYADDKDCLAKVRRTLLFVGRVYSVKALDSLIKAFTAANVPGWKLRIVGPDQAGHQAELEKLCEQLKDQGLKFNVEFAGPKFDDELAAEYENCDCLALVSHTENFGATVVDAMAHGKPVITSTNTPWEEVATRFAGWWVSNEIEPLSKAMGEMMRLSDAERAEMGRRGRRLVEEKYTWEAVAKKLAEGYGRILI